MAEDKFRDSLLAGIPSLRAFGFSLTHNWEVTDDLVQDTLTRAWANRDRFETGSNMLAWLFTILRNTHYSRYRTKVREVEDPDGSYAENLQTHPEQHAHLEFQDMQAALQRLPMDQREALLLVAAEGMSYEDTAVVLGVAVGTVKSRVSRARAQLAKNMGLEPGDDFGPDWVVLAAVQH